LCDRGPVGFEDADTLPQFCVFPLLFADTDHHDRCNIGVAFELLILRFKLGDTLLESTELCLSPVS
jgi:hypothetical protein